MIPRSSTPRNHFNPPTYRAISSLLIADLSSIRGTAQFPASVSSTSEPDQRKKPLVHNYRVPACWQAITGYHSDKSIASFCDHVCPLNPSPSTTCVVYHGSQSMAASMQENKWQPNLQGEHIVPLNKPINRIAIVGTGLIGGSWAALYLAHGFDVVATDPAPGAESFEEPAKLHSRYERGRLRRGFHSGKRAGTPGFQNQTVCGHGCGRSS